MVSYSDNDRLAVWKRLGEFEKMNAAELKTARSNHKHFMSTLAKEAIERLKELQLDDLDDIWSFRVTGERRFWCIKHENIYALLWWDPESPGVPGN